MPDDPFYAALIWGAGGSIICAVAGGLLTKLTPWYFNLKKPKWKPPDFAFGPIWTVIFILLTMAIAYGWAAASDAQRPFIFWTLIVNGILNMAWSALFFTLKRPDWAMIEVVLFWLSIVAVIYALGSASTFAAILVLPYLAWVTAASVLNYQIIQLNRA
jgi:translocator protein